MNAHIGTFLLLLCSCLLSSACGDKADNTVKKAPPVAVKTLGAAPARVVTGECGPGDARFESGPRPAKPDTGGTGWGTIGTGRYGTIGHGSGTGSGYGVGSGGGKGGLRGRNVAEPKVKIGTATATGDLDKNIIRRYIRQKLAQIEYCYAKQLVVETTLAGTITVQFTISGNGAVIEAKAEGMGNEKVESCVADTIKSIQFPKPKGGGMVNVTYPFTFSPGDGAAGPPPKAPASTPDAPPVAQEPVAAAPVNLLAGQEKAIGACLAKQGEAWGVALVELSVDAAGKLSGAKAYGLAAGGASDCLAELAGKLTVEARGVTLRCPLAWGVMPHDALPHVDIDDTAISLDGKSLQAIEPLLADDSPEWKVMPLYQALRARIDARTAGAEPISLSGPLVVRPLASTRAKLLLRVWTTVYAADGNAVLAVKRDKGWELLQPLETPLAPLVLGGALVAPGPESEMAPEPPVQLSVMVSEDSVWIGITTGDLRQVKHVNNAVDLAGVRAVVAEFKATDLFKERRDAEVSLEDPVTYGVLVSVIDLMNEVGFTDWAFTTPDSLSVRFKM